MKRKHKKEVFDVNDPTHWLKMFQKVNRDCSRDGEPVYPFWDVEVYTEQIFCLLGHGLGEENYELAKVIALQMSRL